MDKERRKKLQTTKLIITEIFMLLVIVVTVIVLTFVVMGYRVTEDGTIEQSGLVQVESIPTGATVAIDGEQILAKTNTSRILPEGTHKVVVSREGYLTWEREISIRAGLLLKLDYARLYKAERKTEEMAEITGETEFFETSPTRDSILYMTKGSPVLTWVSLRGDTATTSTVDLTTLLMGASGGAALTANYTGAAKLLAWNKDGNRILLQFTRDGAMHFGLVDLSKPTESVDLTTEFGLAISEARFATDYGEKLYILENGNLRSLSLSDLKASGVLVSKVEKMANYGSDVVYITMNTEGVRELRLYRENEKKTTFLGKMAEGGSISLSEYLGRATVAVVSGGRLAIYRGELPTEDVLEEDLMEKVGEKELGFSPGSLEIRAKGRAILATSWTHKTVFDLETEEFSEFSTGTDLTFWLDDYTIGEVADGKLVVRDFDGQNRLELGAAQSGYDAVITTNNRYLYYVSKNKQEKIVISRDNLR